MPPVDPTNYILEAWEKIGRCRVEPHLGHMPLQWSEIAAFCDGHPVISEHWERQLLYDMSCAYTHWLLKGANPFSIPPMELDAELETPQMWNL